jgi:hypothetical protein
MYSDAELLGILMALLLVLAIGVAIFVFIIKSSSKDDQRPNSGLFDTSSAIMNMIDCLAGKIPGFSDDDLELNSMQGSFVTAASLPPTWEAILRSFKNREMVNTADPGNNWQLQNVFDCYHEMRSVASITETATSPSIEGCGGVKYEFKVTVYLTLKFHSLSSSGTRIDFQYRLVGVEPMEYSVQMVYYTNKSLRRICENLTFNPASYGF